MKMEPIVSSETSAIRTQTPGNYPKRNKCILILCTNSVSNIFHSRKKCSSEKSSTRFKSNLKGIQTPRTSKATYLLIPWCRVLLEKLTGLKLVKKFPAFHGTQRFITALTNVRHLSLSGPAQSSPYTHIPPPGDPSKNYPPIYA